MENLENKTEKKNEESVIKLLFDTFINPVGFYRIGNKNLIGNEGKLSKLFIQLEMGSIDIIKYTAYTMILVDYFKS